VSLATNVYCLVYCPLAGRAMKPRFEPHFFASARHSTQQHVLSGTASGLDVRNGASSRRFAMLRWNWHGNSASEAAGGKDVVWSVPCGSQRAAQVNMSKGLVAH
jgi:hypothetical protein